jgi:hypothetical protein
LGHHITNIIVTNVLNGEDNDPDAGGAHDEANQAHPNLAWDEGRAHFYSWVFTRLARLPGERSFPTNWAEVTEPARRENYVGEGLVDHYGNRALYPTWEDALRDFRQVHRRAVENGSLGRPLRTLADFIHVKQETATGAIAADLAVMAERFGLGN